MKPFVLVHSKMRTATSKYFDVAVFDNRKVTKMGKLLNNLKLIKYTIELIKTIDSKRFIIATSLAIFAGLFPIISLMITQNIVNEIQLMKHSFEEVITGILTFFIASIIATIVRGVSSYNMYKLSNQLTYGINYMLMKKCGDLSLEKFEQSETYNSINRLEQEISVKPYQTLQSLLSMVSNMISYVSALILLATWNIWIDILLFLISLAMLFGEVYIGNKEFHIRYARSEQERKAWYYSYLMTHDTSFKEIKIFGLNNFFLNKYKQLGNLFIKQSNNIEKNKLKLNIAISIVQDIMGLLVMYYSIKEAYKKIIMIGNAMSYMNSISIIQTSTMSMATNIYMIYNSNLYISLLRDFLDDADEKEMVSGKTIINTIREIEFKNVGYTYPENRFSVHNISFTIKPGDRIAIFGKNGSGKSTLFKILCGLYKPSEGRMLINGIDINDISLKSYRNRISVLFQDFLKYEGTVLENVILGDIETDLQDDSVYDALKNAEVDFVLKNGKNDLYQTIGTWFDNGKQLSGGQWQKIALSRAYYKQADMYMLDEPSAALDAESETKIFTNYMKISKEKIAVYITHRAKIAAKADKIFVMENGEIIDIGTHDDLMCRCIIYQNLYYKDDKLC